ncbi:MAG: hypothetical protein LBE91_19720 [Tannerella sp.]|jgi:hypothetical protein|nr:hypothetical protein [Tannerella sp.]
MAISIKELNKPDYPLLEDFIYWAIFTPIGAELPARDIIYNPDVLMYIENFGNKKDCGVVGGIIDGIDVFLENEGRIDEFIEKIFRDIRNEDARR